MARNNEWAIRVSDVIESDAATTDLADVLEKLGTGAVRVSRTDVHPDTQGYTWYVTFIEEAFSAWRLRDDPTPLLIPYGDTLTGPRARVTVTEINSKPTKVRPAVCVGVLVLVRVRVRVRVRARHKKVHVDAWQRNTHFNAHARTHARPRTHTPVH